MSSYMNIGSASNSPGSSEGSDSAYTSQALFCELMLLHGLPTLWSLSFISETYSHM